MQAVLKMHSLTSFHRHGQSGPSYLQVLGLPSSERKEKLAFMSHECICGLGPVIFTYFW